ncbi:hypothetical protein FB451DRAFT_1404663 [Mycena latifolia]|nr:hypothetical protein FB451DRAFT_1404663 [Mycena latifolia]
MVVWTQRFQSLGLDLSKAEFKKLQTDTDNFIKREIFGAPARPHLKIHRRVVNTSHASTFTLYASNGRPEHPCASAARSAAPSISIVYFDVPRVGLRLLSPLNLRVLDAASAPHASYERQRRAAPPPSFHYIFRHPVSGATPAAPCTSFNNLFGVPATAIAASLTFAS